jgi:hypothetical protein
MENTEKVFIIMKRAVKVGSKSVVHAVFVDGDLAEKTRKDLAISAQDLMYYYTEIHGITRT